MPSRSRANRQSPDVDPATARDVGSGGDADDLIVEVASDAEVTEFMEPIYFQAEHAVRRARTALEAELSAGELLGLVNSMIPSGLPDAERTAVLTEFLAQLVGHAERLESAAGLAVLRALSVAALEPVNAIADAAASRTAAKGVKDRSWVRVIGAPTVGRCWSHVDVGGKQESVTMTFAYGTREHAVTLLIDHALGGGVRDCWVSDQPDQAWRKAPTAGRTAGMVVEPISWQRARGSLRAALAAAPCPADDEQAENVALHSGLLRARLALMDGAPPVVSRRPTPVVRDVGPVRPDPPDAAESGTSHADDGGQAGLW